MQTLPRKLKNINNKPGLPGVARDDSNEVLKRVSRLKCSQMTKVCWDGQTHIQTLPFIY